MERLGNILETIFSKYYLFLIPWSAYLLFLKVALLYSCFKAKGKASLGVTSLVFFPHHPPSFSPIKSMYELSFHPSLAFPHDLENLWASSYIWKLLYAPMGDLTSFGKPTFFTISNGIFMHLNISCNYILQNPITS